MKKIISTSIIFISLAFASCTNENSIASDKIAFEETKAVTPQEEFSLEVQQINSEIFKLQTEVYNERAITRGFWKNLLKVAFADAIGFFNTGSIRKSAAASTQKAADIYLEEKEKENNKKGQDKGTLPINSGKGYSNTDCALIHFGNESGVEKRNQYEYKLTDEDKESLRLASINNKDIQNAGVIHNELVGNFVSNADRFTLWTKEGYENMVACAKEALKVEEMVKGIPEGALSKDSTIISETANYIKLLRTGTPQETVEEYIERMKKENPQEAELATTIKNYLEGLDNIETDDNLKQYSEKVVQLVNNSKLSQERKDALCRGISVGFASAKLWKNSSLYKK